MAFLAGFIKTAIKTLDCFFCCGNQDIHLPIIVAAFADFI